MRPLKNKHIVFQYIILIINDLTIHNFRRWWNGFFLLSPSLWWRTSLTKPSQRTRAPPLSARLRSTTQRSRSPGTKAPRNWTTAKSTTSAAWGTAIIWKSRTARSKIRATTAWCAVLTSPTPNWRSRVRVRVFDPDVCLCVSVTRPHVQLFHFIIRSCS